MNDGFIDLKKHTKKLSTKNSRCSQISIKIIIIIIIKELW